MRLTRIEIDQIYEAMAASNLDPVECTLAERAPDSQIYLRSLSIDHGYGNAKAVITCLIIRVTLLLLNFLTYSIVSWSISDASDGSAKDTSTRRRSDGHAFRLVG